MARAACSAIGGEEAIYTALLVSPEDAEATLEVTGAHGVQHFRPRSHLQHDPDGHVVLRFTLFKNVTHFKRLDRLTSDFLAAVSHEFRTPLASLGVAVDLQLRRICGMLTGDQRDLLAPIKADQVHLKKLVQNLLDLARLE